MTEKFKNVEFEKIHYSAKCDFVSVEIDKVWIADSSSSDSVFVLIKTIS